MNDPLLPIARLTHWMALFLLLITTLALPLGYFATSYIRLQGTMEAEIKHLSDTISDFVSRSPTTWTFEEHRFPALIQSFLQRGRDRDEQWSIRVHDAGGNEVIELHQDEPVEDSVGAASFSADFFDFGQVAGRVEIVVSLRQLMWDTLLLMVGGLTLGLLIYFPMRRIPLNALKGTLEELHGERDKLNEVMEELRRADQAKSNFLTNMSHEIRTPMNAIIGMTDLALRTELNDDQRNYMQKVSVSAQSLLRIINDILDFSKIEAGKLEMELVDFELAELVDRVISLLQPSADAKGLRLSVDIDKDTPEHLRGDPLRLGQVLANLGNNAIKFSHENGEVAFRIRGLGEREGRVQLGFSVQDSGVGIDPQEREKLFESFNQADNSITRKYGGTGLGLAICRQLVTMMDGHIQVHSEPGKGSLFGFTVILDKATSLSSLNEQTESPCQPSAQALLSGLRILLVEDNDINQELVCGLLEPCNTQITLATNGAEALTILEDCEDSFDVVLMDCQMPVMDGYEATRRIRDMDACRDLPIIALTANAMKGDRERAVEAGMSDYISKPIDADLLLRSLVHWAQARMPGATRSDPKSNNEH